jgi:hypothetical protein
LATAFEEHKEATDALSETVANKQNKNVIVYKDSATGKASMTATEILEKVKAGDNLYYTANLSEGTLHPFLEGSTQIAFFYSNYIDNTRVMGTGISIDAQGNITTETYQLAHLKDTTIHITAAEREKWNGIDLSNYYLKTETDELLEAKANVENPEFSGTMNLNGEAWFSGDIYTGSTSGTGKDEGSKKVATEEYVEALYQKLNSNTVLGFYCVEDVTIITNGNSKTYPANSNVEVAFIEGDVFEIVPTSNNSIFQLTAFPGALGTFYPWLEGVKQFSNILFDMNAEEMYTKWNQGNQGAYQVQYAQYANCIFWSDNAYISNVAKRPNYTLYYSAQLPLCYSTIPDNTFKSFYLAFNVNSDPNWGNKAYRDSFAKATHATQVFSYYGARTIGIFGHDNANFNITLPKDCRGLMYAATAIENAGTFDAVNTTNFGAGLGSWREAFGYCSSLRNLYIKNLKANLNISWSPINYDSIYFIISEAANTSAITISVSPYTYNLLSESDFALATSKNITITLVTSNYTEDRRLGAIANKADKTYVDEKIADLVNSAPETLDTLGELATAFSENKEVVDALDEAITNKKDKDLIVTYAEGSTFGVTHNTTEIYEAVQNGITVYFQKNTELLSLMEITPTYATFFMFYMNMEGKPQQKVVVINDSSIMLDQDDTYNYATAAQLNSYYNKTEVDNLLSSVGPSEDVLLKTEQTLTNEELDQVRQNLRFIGKNVEGQTFNINGADIVAAANAEIFGDYDSNKCTGQWSIVEGSTNVATGRACHVEGAQNQALNDGCHVEGVSCIASGYWSHAEGEMTRVTSYASHAEGSYTKMPDGTTRYGTASGYASHIEGGGCHAEGSCSHAEGLATTAKSNYSHSEGKHTVASSPAQHVEGAANIEDANSTYIHIAGNGDFGAPSNAYTLDWSGNAWYSGDVYVGSTSGVNKDEGSKKLLTEEDVLALLASYTGFCESEEDM